MPLVVQAKNYRGLAEVDWEIPPGSSVLVGANGAGKTKLLFLMDLLRHIVGSDAGVTGALVFYGGARAMKYLSAPPNEPVVLGARWNDIHWQIDVVPQGGGVTPSSAERLLLGKDVLFERIAASPTVTWKGTSFTTDGRSVFRRLAEADLAGTFPGRPLVEALKGCHIHFDYDLKRARQGSEGSPHPRLSWNGLNVFSVLRNWRDWTRARRSTTSSSSRCANASAASKGSTFSEEAMSPRGGSSSGAPRARSSRPTWPTVGSWR